MQFPRDNINSILRALNERGITNPYLQAGILATVAKESQLHPQSEKLNYTSAARLMQVWPDLFPTVQSAQPYLYNPEKLGNYVYGGKFGNSVAEGFLYRGRGYNGLTFKNNYKKIGSLIGVNLVDRPDLANDLEIAADILAVFYQDQLKKSSCNVSRYSRSGGNAINDLESGVRVAVAVTAGCPTAFGNIQREDLAEAMQYAPELLDIAKSYRGPMGLRRITTNVRAPLVIAAVILLLIVVLLIIYRKELAEKLS